MLRQENIDEVLDIKGNNERFLAACNKENQSQERFLTSMEKPLNRYSRVESSRYG